MNKVLKLMFLVLGFALLFFGAVLAYNRLQYLADVDLININIQDHSRLHAYMQENATDNVAYTEYGIEDLPQAPNFTVYNQLGELVQLHDFIGQPIILNFWASWCPSCRQESPYFEEIYQNFGDEFKMLKVVLLDGQRETFESVDNFMSQNGYTFPLHFDTEGSASRAYGVSFIPITFFINAGGYIAAHLQGAASAEALETGMQILGIHP